MFGWQSTHLWLVPSSIARRNERAAIDQAILIGGRAGKIAYTWNGSLCCSVAMLHLLQHSQQLLCHELDEAAHRRDALAPAAALCKPCPEPILRAASNYLGWGSTLIR